MKTKTIETYKFTELPDDVQARLIDDHIARTEYLWADDAHKTIDTFFYDLEKVGIAVKDWDINPWGRSYVRLWRGNNVGSLKGRRAWKYLKNNFPRFCEDAENYDKLPLTGFCMDWDILKPLHEFLKNPGEETTLDEVIQTCVDSWAAVVQADMEYCFSEESAREALIDLNYDYTISGQAL